MDESLKQINEQKRTADYGLSEMSIEEFQRLASKYFGNSRVRLEPFYWVGKDKNGTIMKEENTLYYVQSFSARGVVYDVNGVPVTADLKIGISVAGENYFLSDATYYLIINDFVCDEMSCQDMAWTGGGVQSDSNALYAVGWKAIVY
ncbi:hypothetical protein [Mariniphaga sediminis]|uniref:hypothetical protein n=1 Tax=Mariniphaga sediminis TaxID=1628158 RepID=UPI003567E41C